MWTALWVVEVTRVMDSEISVPCNLPRRRGALLGREEEHAALDEALSRERRVTLLSSAPCPFGGSGLSALALAYAEAKARSGAYPAGVFRLAAAGRPADVLARFAVELRALGSPKVRGILDEEPLDAPADTLARAVRLALQGERAPSLLVLDEVDAEGWADRLPFGEVRVIAVSHHERFVFRRRVLVPPLSGAAAANLARSIGARPHDGPGRQALEGLVVRELAGLPLAVELAARYVKHTGRSWVDYASLLRVQGRRVQAERAPPAGYPPHVVAAIDVAIEHHPQGTPARCLLDSAAVLAPRAAPLAWVLAAAELDRAGAVEALDALQSLGLVVLDDAEEVLSMHRLVHRRAREKAPMDAWVRASRRAASNVAVWLSDDTGAVRCAEIDARRAHVEAALDGAETSGADLAWVLIAGRLATCLERGARYDEARVLFERALERAERLEPPDPGQVRVCLSNLAGLLVETGHPREARPLLERAVAIDDSADEEAPSSVRMSRLSRVLQDVGNASAARPLLERALEPGAEQAPPPGTRLPEAARVLQELRQAPGEGAVLERALSGSADDAPSLSTLLRVVEQAASAHTSSAEMTSLGISLYALGHPGEARPLLERALASDEAAHGPDHPAVAAALLNLAAVVRSLGETERARAFLVRAKVIAEATLPQEDPLRGGIATRLSKL